MARSSDRPTKKIMITNRQTHFIIFVQWLVPSCRMQIVLPHIPVQFPYPTGPSHIMSLYQYLAISLTDLSGSKVEESALHIAPSTALQGGSLTLATASVKSLTPGNEPILNENGCMKIVLFYYNCHHICQFVHFFLWVSVPAADLRFICLPKCLSVSLSFSHRLSA